MTPETSLKLYREMLRLRLVEEKIAEAYPEQEMRCPVHLCIGQEAVAVGVCAHLTREDYVFSAHRSHGHYLGKGGDLKAMMAELYGKVTGCARGIGGSMHLIDRSAGFLGAAPIVGSTIPIAVGAAFGSVMRAEKRVTTVFFGEGATEEGVFHESLNFAALKELPVLFVCENNLYSVYSPLAVRQPARRSMVRIAAANTLHTGEGNGNDIAEVHAIAGDAIRRIREGGGPVFLEFSTYRWREHCGPNYDNDLGYRTPEEFEDWKGRCPIRTFEERLLDAGILTAEQVRESIDCAEAEIRTAIAFAKESPFPDESTVANDVYAPTMNTERRV